MRFNKTAIALAAVMAAGTASAAATGPDLSSLTGAVVVGTVTIAVLAVQAVKVVPLIAKWGSGMIVRMFGR